MNSGGSMTDRTFRSPSPNGRSSVVPASSDAPPVPALPSNVTTGRTRASSVEPPQRVISPGPTRGARGVSADSSSVAIPGASRLSKRLSNLDDREESAGGPSKNFSRPISSQQSSPVVPISESRYTHGTGSWFAEPGGSKDTSAIRSTAADAIRKSNHVLPQQQAQSASFAPIAKKKKSAPSLQGSHLTQANKHGAEGSGASSTSYDTADSVMTYDPNTRTFVSKPRDQSRAPEPSSPTTLDSTILTPAPGTYDPSTRSLVPRPSASRTNSSTSETASATKKKPVLSAVNTTLAPPPRNPARVSPTSPTSPRASGFLQHQPSIVREDPEREEQEATPPRAANVKVATTAFQTSTGPAKAYAAPSTSHQRSSSLDVPRQALGNGTRGRGSSTSGVSASPARSAHFSASPVIEATRHAPPPRSISPAKSAMKHSPASSVRGSSPMTMFSSAGSKAPPSETSDTTSLASQDGVASKKKKNARVSFDEQPHDLGPSALVSKREATFDDDTDYSRPRAALPSFGSIRKDRGQAQAVQKVTEIPPAREESSSDHMIGGIIADYDATRMAKGDRPDESDDEAPPTSSEVPTKSDNEKPAQAKDSNLLGATVSTVSTGNNYSLRKTDNGNVPAINLLPPTPGIEEEEKRFTSPDSSTADKSPKPKSSMTGFNIPGSWAREDDTDVNSDTVEQVSATPVSEDAVKSSPSTIDGSTVIEQQRLLELSAIHEDSDDSAAFSDAEEDLSYLDDGGFASLDAIVSSPIMGSPANAKGVASKSPPDSPSVLQAPKRPSHISEDSGDWTAATAYWSQLSKQQRDQIERHHFSSDDETSAVKKPVKKKKSALKQATQARPSDPRTSQTMPVPKGPPPGSLTAQPSAMKKTMRAQAAPQPTAAPSRGVEEVRMRRSMRDGGGTLPSTMRNGPPAHTRPQSEHVEPRSLLQKSDAQPTRPKSSGTALSARPAGSRQRTDSEASQGSSFPSFSKKATAQQSQTVAPSDALPSKLQRQLSHDSDSESSFKKKRRPSASNVDAQQNKYSMKRSMRAGSVGQASIEERPISPTPAGKGRGAFSLRSLSPTGSMMSRNKGANLRESLRTGSVDAGSTRMTLRNSAPPAATMRSGGMSGVRAPPRSAAPTAKMSMPRFKSRFNDSDDDDEPRATHFRSRFVDSDDDEPSSPVARQAELAPVRGIPRRQGQYDGDSTDLEGEELEEAKQQSKQRTKQTKSIVPDPADVEKAMEAARKKLGIPAPGVAANIPSTEGSALQTGSLRKPPAMVEVPNGNKVEDLPPKKKGFMGSILRRNRNSSASIQTVSPSSPQAVSTSPAVGSPRPGLQSASMPASPSPGKLVRRISQQPQPKMTRGDSSFSTATAPASSSPLRTLGQKNGEDWPLPPVPKVTANGVSSSPLRPNTSDGNVESITLPRTLRPEVGIRSQSGQVLGNRVRIESEDGHDVEDGGRGVARPLKKKRFGLLRKAFGLDD